MLPNSSRLYAGVIGQQRWSDIVHQKYEFIETLNTLLVIGIGLLSIYANLIVDVSRV